MRKKREDWDSNRDIAKKAKLGTFWCWGCDAQIVGEYEKCPRCGYKEKAGKRRHKKPYPE
jgi:ribosomal protein L40E